MRETLGTTISTITKGFGILALLVGPSTVLGQNGTRDAVGSGVPNAEVPAPNDEDSPSPDIVPEPTSDADASAADVTSHEKQQATSPAESWPGPEDKHGDRPWMDTSSLNLEPPVYSSGSWVWSGRWYTQQDVVLFNKFRPNRMQIATTAGGASQYGLDAEMNNDSDKQGIGAGTRLTFGHLLGRDSGNRDQAVEFTFLGLFEWDSHGVIGNIDGPDQVNASLQLSADRSLVGFTNNDEQTADYSSDLNSFEMNFRTRTRPGRDQMALQPNGIWVRHSNSSTVRSILGGFRFISANDSLLVQGFDVTDGTRTREGLYLVQTNNDLFGMQVGFDLQTTMNEINWGLRGKVGALYNFADRRSRVSPTPAQFVTPLEKVIDNHLSFLSEISLMGMYKFRPNIGIRVGYDILFVSNIGLAAENLGLNGVFPNFNHNGNGFYHGSSAGFEVFW